MTETKNVIVLLTDFGHKDIFTGILKGVIVSINPASKMIDLTHDIKAQNIMQAAFLLAASFSYFPPKSVFCIVVDPGVGSGRKAICIKTKDYYFVGPDNGVLWQAAQTNGIEKILHLTNTSYFLEPVSHTFHGRDIFSPVAAHLSKDFNIFLNLGDPIKTCVEYQLPEPVKDGSSLKLTVFHIDRFGNITLNLREKAFHAFVQNKEFCLTINDILIKKVYRTYAEAKDSEFFIIGSSASFMEISLKNANAAEKLKADVGQNTWLKTGK